MDPERLGAVPQQPAPHLPPGPLPTQPKWSAPAPAKQNT